MIQVSVSTYNAKVVNFSILCYLLHLLFLQTGRSAGAVATSSGGLLNTLLWLLLLPYNTVLGVIRSVLGGGAPARPK